MKIPETAPELDPGQVDPSVSADPESLRLSREYNERYLHWDELQYRECGRYGRLGLWYLMKLGRESSANHLSIGNLALSYNILNDFQRKLHLIDMSLSTGFVPAEKMDEKRKLMYAVSSFMEESIASSQIEGASTTTKAAKKMLRSKTEPRNKSERMILNNYNAMQFIKSKADEPLTPALIREIHAVISQGTLEDASSEGCFRTDDSVVVADPLTGKVYHQPVPAADVESMVSELCDFANGDEPFVHPILKGIIIHFVMAYIHPFVDGNGRVSRSLFYWFAIKKGYGIVEYLSISRSIKAHRGKYGLAYLLSETDGNDLTYFIRYNLDIIMESIDAFSDYLDRKLREQDDALERMRAYGLSTRQEDVLAELIQSGEPATAYELASMFGTDVQNIRKDLVLLMDKGLVEIRGKDGHRIMYAYTGER